MKARYPERLPRRHYRLLTAIDQGSRPEFKARAAVVLSQDGRGLAETLEAPGVSAIFTVEDRALGILLSNPAVGRYLRLGIPVVVALESARDAAELHSLVETGARVQ